MDFPSQLAMLRSAGGDPALLALATVDLAHHALEGEERARIRQALLAASVPHWFDGVLLAAMLGCEGSEGMALVARLRVLAVVEPFPARGHGAYNVHERARRALREHLRLRAPLVWLSYSQQSSHSLRDDARWHARIETLFHEFAVDQPRAARACELMAREVLDHGRPELRHAHAQMLSELTAEGWLTGAAAVEALLAPLTLRDSRGETTQLLEEAQAALDVSLLAGYLGGASQALALLGKARAARGELAKALDACEQSLTLAQHLADQTPLDRDRLRDLAAAHNRRGDVLEALGRLKEAHAAFSKDSEICDGLVTLDPSSIQRQQDLADACNRLGGVLEALGELDGARIAFERDLTISSHLAAEDATNVRRQRALATAHARLGGVLEARDKLDEADGAYRKVLTILGPLAFQDPANAGLQHELAATFARLGGVLEASTRLDEASASFRECVVILDRLCAHDPTNAGWKSDLALAHGRHGAVLAASGHHQEAHASYLRHLELSQLLLEQEPTSPARHRTVAHGLRRLASVLSALEESSKAASCLSAAVEAMERAVTLAPMNSAMQAELAKLRALRPSPE